MKPLTVLGVMSGTSLDGVDYAWCRITSARIKLLHLSHSAFPGRMRARLLLTAEGKTSSHEMAQLHHDLGRYYARGALKAAGPKTDLCGLHGQTVFHRPHPSQPATFQLGESTYLGEALGIPVVHNFRAGDMAVGGEGAPLATLFHQKIFARKGSHTCVNNLGGISNVTSLDWRQSREPKILSFDTGPANLLLDMAAKHYTGGRFKMDRWGKMAARGIARSSLLKSWLRHPFFKQKPPKSTGRELFGEECFIKYLKDMKQARISKHDALATLSSFTAHSLAMQYRDFLPTQPDRLILTGGGAANPILVGHIRDAMVGIGGGLAPKILTSEDLGWPMQSVEPAAFAWLAWRRWHGLPGTIPNTTGARRAVWLGQITQLQ